MVYVTMKKLISNAVAKYQSEIWTREEYEEYKGAQQHKLDVFYALGRLTELQYEELTGVWVE